MFLRNIGPYKSHTAFPERGILEKVFAKYLASRATQNGTQSGPRKYHPSFFSGNTALCWATAEISISMCYIQLVRAPGRGSANS
jgi:hypothetical protein